MPLFDLDKEQLEAYVQALGLDRPAGDSWRRPEREAVGQGQQKGVKGGPMADVVEELGREGIVSRQLVQRLEEDKGARWEFVNVSGY